MSRNIGTFNFPANIEVLTKAPLDAKQKVTEKACLIAPATWNQSGSVWLYDGAMVVVSNDSTPENNGIYWLCDSANYTNYSSWIQASTGGTGGGVGTLTGATNGINISGGDTVSLGGTLVNNTIIDGAGTYKMCYNDVTEFNANSGTSIAMCYNATDLKLLHSSKCAIINSTRIGLINGSNSISVCDSGFAMVSTGSSVTMKTNEGFIYGGAYTSSNPNWIPTKSYVDTVGVGLSVKDSVYVATTENTTLSGHTVIDGITVTTGQRVLVKNQTNASENGVYSASTGVWGRTSDYDFDSGEVSNGDLFPVVTGNTQDNSLWALTSENPVVSGDSINFTLFNRQIGYTEGVGISININEFSVDGTSLAGNSINWTANQFAVDPTIGTLATALGNKLNVTSFETFTGTTLPNNYYNKTQINSYTGDVNTSITNIETITDVAVTGGTNGITKTGRNVLLGGALTQNTSITGGETYCINIGESGNMLCNYYSYACDLISINARCDVNNYTNVNLTPENLRLITNVTGSTRELKINTIGMFITDDVDSKGLQYVDNYRSNFTEYSLVDAGFVTGLTSLGLLTASNGLTVSGTDVKLGGNLSQDTIISGTTHDFMIKSGGGGLSEICFTIEPNEEYIYGQVLSPSTTSRSEMEVYNCSITNIVYENTTGYTKICHRYTGVDIVSNVNGHIKYCDDYSSAYTLRSVPDVNYITGLTSQSILTANNGLSKTGTTAILGGSIDAETCLYTTNATNCTYLNISRSANTITTYTKGGNINLCTVGAGNCINVSAPSGITYTSCLHNTYIDRSLVDKEYVDNRANFVNVRCTSSNPFYVTGSDYFVGVSGYTVGSCACVYLHNPATDLCVGQRIVISDMQGQALSYPITIDGNGKCVNGMSCGIAEINTNYGSISLIYNGVFWSPTAFVN